MTSRAMPRDRSTQSGESWKVLKPLDNNFGSLFETFWSTLEVIQIDAELFIARKRRARSEDVLRYEELTTSIFGTFGRAKSRQAYLSGLPTDLVRQAPRGYCEPKSVLAEIGRRHGIARVIAGWMAPTTNLDVPFTRIAVDRCGPDVA